MTTSHWLPLADRREWLASIHRAHNRLSHGSRPTEAHVKVATRLALWQHAMPSHARLARAAGCCTRTVQNALKRLRGLGLLIWRHEGATMRSGRRLQLPNRYRLLASFLPAAPTRQKDNTRNQYAFLQVGKHCDWWRKPEPQAPVRTVAQQLAIMMAG